MKANTAQLVDHTLEIQLNTALNVNNIGLLKKSVDRVFANAKEIKIHISDECTELDITGVQLFYALNVHCNSTNKSISISGGLNDSIKNSFALAGFDSWFSSLLSY